MNASCKMWVLLGGLCTVAIADADAQDEKPPPPPLEFLVLKEAYAKKIAEIGAQVEANETEPLLEKYAAALTRLEDAEAKKGNLDGLVSIRDERKRAAEDVGITEKQISKNYPELAKVQRQLLGAIAKIDSRRQTKVNAISEKYLEKLRSLRTKYTKGKKVDAALAVDAEAKRIGAQLNAGKKPKPLVAKKDDDGLKLEGKWVLVRGDGKIRINVDISKIDENRFLMGGSASLTGEYTWNKRKFAKVRKEGDTYWDIVWVRRGGAFLNTGKHYTDWMMVRPEEEGAEKD